MFSFIELCVGQFCSSLSTSLQTTHRDPLNAKEWLNSMQVLNSFERKALISPRDSRWGHAWSGCQRCSYPFFMWRVSGRHCVLLCWVLLKTSSKGCFFFLSWDLGGKLERLAWLLVVKWHFNQLSVLTINPLMRDSYIHTFVWKLCLKSDKKYYICW